MVLSSVNGITLIKSKKCEKYEDLAGVLAEDHSIIKRNTVGIANLYFKFAHKQKNCPPKATELETYLPNAQQE